MSCFVCMFLARDPHSPSHSTQCFSGPQLPNLHCPLKLLSHVVKTTRLRKHLTRCMVTSVLKRWLPILVFMSLAFFSTHSLRIGGMSCGTKADMKNSTLCKIGCWISDSEARYREIYPTSGILSVLDAYQMDTTVPSSHLRTCVESFLHPYSSVSSCPFSR